MKTSRAAVLLLMAAAMSSVSSSKFGSSGLGWPGSSVSEPPEIRRSGGSLRSTPATRSLNLELLAVVNGPLPAQPEVQPPPSLEEKLLDELGAAGVAEDDNLLWEVARRMHEVEGRIARNDSGLATQGQQRQILADLDRLIEQARKSCQGSKPSDKPSKVAGGGQSKQGPPGKKPGTQPGAAGGQRTADDQGREPDRQQMRTHMQQLWEVALPKQQRDQLQQWSFDEFLPKYELLIEQYFRRLAEEEDER